MRKMTPAKKKYAPVRVVNPVGDNHLVCLNPHQSFLVLISPWVGMTDLQIESPFFALTKEEKLRDGTRIFHYGQKYDLTHWAKVGSVYLGQLLMVGQHVAASMCVVLSSDQTDVFTTINPRGTEIKVHPHQILEVVLYDKTFHGKWNVKPIPGDDNVTYREIGHESIVTSIDVTKLVDRIKANNNFVVFPRAYDDFDGIEHHYWFEYDVPSQRKIAKWKTGTYKGGRLIFEPQTQDGEPPETAVLHVELSVRQKNHKKLAMPRRLPEQLPDSLPFDTRLKGDDNEDRTVLVGEDDLQLANEDPDSTYDDYDSDIALGHIPGWSGARNRSHIYPGAASHITSRRQHNNNNNFRNNNNANSFYTPRAFTTAITIKERNVPEHADPMFIETTAVDQANIPAHLLTQSATKWDRYHHDY